MFVFSVALGWLSKKFGTDKTQPVISALLGHCILPSQCQSNSWFYHKVNITLNNKLHDIILI